jgi:SAM-dependent methyltransferase
MQSIYGLDLAYIHAAAFENLAKGAAAEIVRRLKNCGTPVYHVLDVGCGAGPLTKSLVQAGFRVTGVDISCHLLEAARKNVPEARFIHRSAYDVELRGYQAIVAVGECLTYHADPASADSTVTNFFARAANGLPTGGMVIFDLIGLGQPSLDARTWVAGEDWAVLVETAEDQGRRTLVRSIDIFRRIDDLYRRSREVHTVRLFDIPALRDQLASYGFAVEIRDVYGSQQLPPRRHAFFATRLDTD